jgi:hypothetical protein
VQVTEHQQVRERFDVGQTSGIAGFQLDCRGNARRSHSLDRHAGERDEG